MSTRGLIVFVGADRNGVLRGFRLYQHCDSYPTNTLPVIRDTIRKAEKLAVKGRERMRDDSYSVTPEMLAGLYVGENTSVFGMGARIEAYSALETLERDEIVGLLGSQFDLEWIYVVDTDLNSVNVYGGGYTGASPGTFIDAGTVEPLEYVQNLTEKYQEREAKKITSAKRSLARLGWPVNRRVTVDMAGPSRA